MVYLCKFMTESSEKVDEPPYLEKNPKKQNLSEKYFFLYKYSYTIRFCSKYLLSP